MAEGKSGIFMFSIFALAAVIGIILMIGVGIHSSDKVGELSNNAVGMVAQVVSGSASASMTGFAVDTSGNSLDVSVAENSLGCKWSDWKNRDAPSGTGDWETLVDMPEVCQNAVAVDCQTTLGVDHKSAGQTVSCAAKSGLICQNSLNAGGCKDYKVRFCCPTTTTTEIPQISFTSAVYLKPSGPATDVLNVTIKNNGATTIDLSKYYIIYSGNGYSVSLNNVGYSIIPMDTSISPGASLSFSVRGTATAPLINSNSCNSNIALGLILKRSNLYDTTVKDVLITKNLILTCTDPLVSTCKDSDGSMNVYETSSLYIRGTTSYNGESFTDTCETDIYGHTELREYHCVGDSTQTVIRGELENCPNGCIAGACYYPGFFMTLDKSSYTLGDIIYLNLSSAKIGTYTVDLYAFNNEGKNVSLASKLVVPSSLVYKIATSSYTMFNKPGEYTFTLVDSGMSFTEGQNSNAVAVQIGMTTNSTTYAYNDVCGDSIVGMYEACDGSGIGYGGGVIITLHKSLTGASQETITVGGKEYVIKLLGLSGTATSATLNVNGEYITVMASYSKTVGGANIHMTGLSTVGETGSVTLAVKGGQISECSQLGSGYTDGDLSCTNNCQFDTSECTGAGECTDSDGGNNVYVAGDAGNGNIGTFDGCEFLYGETNKLREAVCLNGTPSHIMMTCPTTAPYCNRAICSTALPKCVDSDNGVSQYVKGTVTEARLVEGPEYTDYCENVNTLQPISMDPSMNNCNGGTTCGVREFSCSGINLNYKDISCPNGCKDGACVQGTTGVLMEITNIKLSSGGDTGRVVFETKNTGEDYTFEPGKFNEGGDSSIILIAGKYHIITLASVTSGHESIYIDAQGPYVEDDTFTLSNAIVQDGGMCILNHTTTALCSYNSVVYAVENLGGCGATATSVIIDYLEGGNILGTSTSIMQGDQMKLQNGVTVKNLGAPCSYPILTLQFVQDATNTCTDSDGGVNYNVKGQVVGPVGPGEGSQGRDYCYTPTSTPGVGDTGLTGTHLLEWYCADNGGAGQSNYQCPNGCKNGACTSFVWNSSEVLKDFPQPFLRQGGIPNAVFVVGRRAALDDVIGITDVIASLQRYAGNNPFPVGLVQFDDVLTDDDIYNRNVVIVGGMCANRVAELMYDSPADCTEQDTPGVGKIRIMRNPKNTDKFVLLVHGYSAEDTTRATRVLANWNDYNHEFKDNSELCITGPLSSITVSKCS